MRKYLDEDQQILAATAGEFARETLLELDRACDRDESSICSALPQIAEMGLLSLRIPTEHGGLGCSRMAYAAILHEVSYASPSTAVMLSVHNMVGEMLLKFATQRVKCELLPQWGSPQSLSSFAISEPDVGSDPGSISTRAVRDQDEWVINGSKMWITTGATGRWFVTLAQTKEVGDTAGLCMILLDANQPGFERIKIEGKMGIRGSETVSLHLTDVRAPHDHLLSDMGSGLKLALLALDGGRVGIAAQSTGIAEACLDEMVSYSKHRVQFGRPIAEFQAIQNMIADSATELAAAKALIAQACLAADNGGKFSATAAKAKLYASEMATRVADRAVQVHGGSGYVNDARVEQLYRDARVTRIYEGTSEIQRLVIARDLLANGVSES